MKGRILAALRLSVALLAFAICGAESCKFPGEPTPPERAPRPNPGH